MNNHEVYLRDPRKWSLANKGVTRVNEPGSEAELHVLRGELESFVCEGEYARGAEIILDRYLDNLDRDTQPGVWVSGFYGSGKSHFVKMLRALWSDLTFADGATARGLVKNLPHGVSDHLKDLSNRARQRGVSLHAASGTLSSGAGSSVRLAVVKIVFESIGLDSSFPVGSFELWLRDNNILDAVRAAVEARGRSWVTERKTFYVSKIIAEAVIAQRPDLDPSSFRKLLLAQFPDATDLSTEAMISVLRTALCGSKKQLPLTLIVLDEVQQFIAADASRSVDVQEVAEAIQKQLDARVLLVATGQSAISSETPFLNRIQARFVLPIPLSDRDVEEVIRKVVLQKSPTAVGALGDALAANLTEIARHLPNSTIRHSEADRSDFVADYPVLPARRRFWEKALRAVDKAGATAQLRNQLTLTHEASRDTADLPIGHVVGADFVIENQEVNLLNAGVLPRTTHEKLQAWRAGGERGRLKARVGALAFVIARLPREKGADILVRANAADLTDLLVTDLTTGSRGLRSFVEDVLYEMERDGDLMIVEGEYRWQTGESAVWDHHFRERVGEIRRDLPKYQIKRAEILKAYTQAIVDKLTLQQGASNTVRKAELVTGDQPPKSDGSRILVWLRDEWSATYGEVRKAMLALGNDSAAVAVLLPKSAETELHNALTEFEAACAVLDSPPPQVSKDKEGGVERDEAQKAMESRKANASRRVNDLLRAMLDQAKVMLAGGTEIAAPQGSEDPFVAMLKAAGEQAIGRLFPHFADADHASWEKALKKARGAKGDGDADALKAVGHQGDAQTHKVAVAIFKHLGSGKTGKELRAHFMASPYGWPQDAVDAVLFTLLVAGQLRAAEGNVPVPVAALDVKRLGTATLQCVSVVATIQQKGTVRSLLAELGVLVKVNEEGTALATLFDQLETLRARAGGEAPRPELPDLSLVTTLRGFVDQDLLVETATRADDLRSTHKRWKETADAIDARIGAWTLLNKLLGHAGELDGLDTLRAQVAAVRKERQLLLNPDPVAPLLDTVVQRLRQELSDAAKRYADAHAEGSSTLASDAGWQKLDEVARGEILRRLALDTVPSVKAGTAEEVERSLSARSLSGWHTERDALPTRSESARVEAAKRIAPRAVSVKLPSRTLHTPEDVAAWIEEARATLDAKVKLGPVIV
ncbi:MAG: BREX system P-loop protein BrxC [Polyangiales bacterium]